MLAELEKRKLKKPQWLNPDFPKQNEFITSKAPLKVVQCTRRAGKSYGAGLYAFKEAYETPGVSVLIVGLTRDSVKRIFFKDILKDIDLKFNIGAKFNGSDLTTTLPNGSIIYLLGVDANPDDMNKLLGQKNKLVVVDEAAFFRQDMHKLVFEILKPSVADYGGTIALVSTTSNLTNTLYYDVTTSGAGGWEVFKWTAYDNPFMAKKWDKEINFLKEHNPGIENTPHFRRMYLNEWHIDEDNLIYKYASHNHADMLPTGHRWNYVLGIDLGYNDPTALVVCAYSEHDPHLYVIETFKQSGMIVSDVGDKIKELDARYQFDTMVVDNASKQAVEELKKRYQLPLIPAEKTSKRDFIELLNSDLIVGHVQVLGGGKALVDEWRELVWDERALDRGKYTEHPSCDNHLADAFLYAWRWCYQYSSKPKMQTPARGTEAEVEAFWEHEAEVIEMHKRQAIDDVY